MLAMDEAAQHPHNVARGSFVEVEGYAQTAPAPRFSRTPGEIQGVPVGPGANSDEVLAEIGLREAEIEQLKQTGAVS